MIAFTVPKPETQGPTRVRVLSSLGTGEECRSHTSLSSCRKAVDFIITDLLSSAYQAPIGQSKTFYFVNVGIIGNIFEVEIRV